MLYWRPLLGLVALAGVAVWLSSIGVLAYLLVGVLGGLVGWGELVSRYRDAPAGKLLSIPAATYVLVNSTGAIVALMLIERLQLEFGLADKPDALATVRVMVAGLSASAFFRTSLFNVRVGDKDIGVGPSSFLQVILDAADREVDRTRAQDRAISVTKVMTGVSFDKASAALPMLCLTLMQNLPKEDQEKLGTEVGNLKTAVIENEIKVLILGLALMNRVGIDVLQSAVNALGQRIK